MGLWGPGELLAKQKAMSMKKTVEKVRKLGRSQQAVYDWLKKRKEAQTAWDVGNALYEDVSMCSVKNTQWHSVRSWGEEKIRTSWARKVLRELVKNGAVREVGVLDRSRTYAAV